jgi:hypothetical protein
MAASTTSGPLQDATQAAKERAGGMWSDATSGIGEFAGALRNAARQIDDGRSPTTARFARQAADSLERISGNLRGRDLDSVVREVEGFARAQPALFLGAAVAAGFLAIRFLKSSNTETSSSTSQGGFDAPDYLP